MRSRPHGDQVISSTERLLFMPCFPSLQRALAALTLAAALYSSGCTTVYEVSVDATARMDRMAPGACSFRIEDRNADGDAGDLRADEIAGLVKTALSAQGLYEAPAEQSADLVVEINYGMGQPRVRQAVYQELLYGRPMSVSDGRGAPPQGVAREMMGYTPMISTTVLREKHLSICARKNPPPGDSHQPEDLWQVHVSIEDEGDDLRGHLPVLASAAMDHMGRSTHGPAVQKLRSDAEAVRFIQRSAN